MNRSKEEKRVGLAFWPGTPTREILQVGKAADEAGVDSLWVTESTLAPGRDAISILGALSSVTTRAKLATGIINIFTRTPTLIASTAATLDELSNGRMVLGLGTGHENPLMKWHSVRFERPLTRMREYTNIIRQLLAGRLVRHQGKTVTVQDLKLSFEPRRQVSIYIAAVGPKMAELGGEVGDGILVTLNTVPQLKKLVEIASTVAKDRGRIIDRAAYALSFISDDPETNLRAARRVLAMYCSAPFYNKVFVGAGFEREAADIAKLWHSNEKERAYELVSENMVRSFASLGLEETSRTVEEYSRAGVSLPVVILADTGGLDKQVRKLLSELPR